MATAAATEQMVKAKQDYEAQNNAEELSFKKNEMMVLLDDSEKRWKVKKRNGEIGYVPSTLMKKVKPRFASKILRNIEQIKFKVLGTSSSRTAVICTAEATESSHYSNDDLNDMLSFEVGERFEVLNISAHASWIVRRLAGNRDVGRVYIKDLAICPQSKLILLQYLNLYLKCVSTLSIIYTINILLS